MISLRCSPRSFWSENAILITLKTPCGIDVVLPTLPPRMVFSHILLSFSYPHRPLEIDTISYFASLGTSSPQRGQGNRAGAGCLDNRTELCCIGCPYSNCCA